MKRIITLIVAIAIIISSFAGCAQPKEEYAIKIGNTEYTVADFNTMYIMTFSSFFSYYGQYLSNTLDLSKPLSEQDNGNGQTWEEYFVDYTVNTLKDLTALYELAIEEGIELEEEDKEYLGSLASSLETEAQEYGSSVQEYITDMYGEGVTYSNIYRISEIESYAIAYQNYYQSKDVLSDEDVYTFYENNKSQYDGANIRFTYVDYTEDIEDEGFSFVEAQKIAVRFQELKTAEEFKKLCAEIYPETEDEYLNDDSMSQITGVHYADLGSAEIADWVFSEERKEGDILVHNDEEYNTFAIIMFEKVEPYDYTLRNMRHVLIAPEAEEDGTTGDAAWKEAEKKAKDLYDEYLKGDKSAESLGEMAKEYTDDPGSKENGGLYKNIYKGQMVEEINSWIFSDERQVGDTELIKTDYGYHIVYFEGEGESYVLYSLSDAAANEKYQLWVSSLNSSIEVTEYEAFQKVGNIIDVIYNKAMARAKELAEAKANESTATDVNEDSQNNLESQTAESSES